MRIFLLFTFLSIGNLFSAQSILINEIDADQPGADSTEFVELVGDPGTSLDGLVLVFFNGGDAINASYQAVDLTGNTIPTSGFFVVGNANVANVNLVVSNNSIQNGADAVVLYSNTTIDAWPDGTAPILSGALDAVVYGTADAEDVDLMAILASGQVQLDEGASNNTTSLSRVPDGGAAFALSLFVAQNPTPGATNGGSTVSLNENELIKITIFPNPTTDHLNIQSQLEMQSVIIYDANGKKLASTFPMSSSHRLQVSQWEQGIYFLDIKTKSGVSRFQWIKK